MLFKMKKGTIQNFMWVIGVIILIIAFIILFWLMASGWLNSSGNSISAIIDKAASNASGV